MGASLSSIFEIGPKKISDNEQNFFIALGVFAPLYISFI